MEFTFTSLGAAAFLAILAVSVAGQSARSPRIGHLHITVDDAKWHFVDTSGETVILVGLEPGPHRVLFELADPTHRVITTQMVAFSVPTPKTPERVLGPTL